ncbi:RHS repeat domain-containing protein [Elizabethkingia meningoseptica]|uniref:RHS repeat domain-containing protein n=1 Tax=Elizabethkingia meningoseptica TaxID=238 RepID=UPI003891C7CF
MKKIKDVLIINSAYRTKQLSIKNRCYLLKFPIWALLILLSNLFNGQLLSGNNLYQVVNTKSPSVSDLAFKGENIGVNQYTGDPVANFNLFSYDLKYLNLDITLGYNIKKVKPEAPPSIAGLGWDIIAGGAITRDVIGWYDEFKPFPPPITDNKFSYYFSGFKDLDNDNWKTTSRIESIYNDKSKMDMYNNYQYGGSHSPDKFILNYGNLNAFFLKNHKGSWISGNAKNIVIKETLKSDWYRVEEQAPNGEKPFYDINDFIYGFEVTDDKGIKYYFGGSPETIEFNSSLNSSLNTSDLINYNFYVKTWYIRKIVLPNNKEINFEYDDDKTATYISHSSSYDYSDTFQGALGKQSSYNGGKSVKSYERNFFKYLRKISFDKNEIIFHKSYSNSLDYDILNYMGKADPNNPSPWDPYTTYNNGGRNFTYSYSYANKYKQNKHWYKIDSITINNNNIATNVFRFNYRDQSDSRLRLQNISIGKSKKNTLNYTFNYNTPELPRYNSERTDHWGYFNNSYYDDKYPKDYNGNNMSISSNKFEDYKEPNIFSKAETLSSIILPTKGKVEFDYELHSYSKFYDYNKPNDFETIKNGFAGGTRIKSILYKDEYENLTTQKNYFYVKDYVHGNLESSGVVTFIPKYSYSIQNNKIDIKSFSTNSYTPTLNEDNSHISYSTITEIIDNKSYIETQYTNHDNGYSNTAPFQNLGYTTQVISNPNQFPFPRLNYKSNRRGKPLTISKYNKDKSLVQKFTYNYQSKKMYNESIRGYAYKFQFWGAPIYHPLGLPATDYSTAFSVKQISAYQEDVDEMLVLSSLIQEDWNNNNVLKTTKEYSYRHSADNYPSIEKTIYSDGKIIEVNNKYPQDIVSNTSSTLLSTNMKSIILEKTTTISESGNDITLSHIYSDYGNSPKTSNLILPISIIDYGLDDQNENTIITYDLYDTKGNILQYSEKGVKPTVVIWGYNQTQPIAKIEGISYAELASKLGFSNMNTGYLSLDIVSKSNADVDAATEQALISALDALRNNAALSGYQITTYTYDPLIGVTSITPPSGIREVYKYDAANRLESVRDVNGNILKEYQYRYKN